MPFQEQWNWVLLAYGFTYFVLIGYAATIAFRVHRARRNLGQQS